MRIQEAMGVGLSGETAKAVAGSCAVQAVSGSAQSDATLVTAANVVVTTSSANQGCILPSDAQIGDCFCISNATGNSIRVYPPTSGQLSGSSANAHRVLATLEGGMFIRVTPTHWFAICGDAGS